MSRLSDLLNGQPVSARQAASRAEGKGIALPYGTIAAYWSGKHGRPSARTLERLAAVLPLSIGQLQQAAWGKSTELGEYIPPREADLLDHRQRRALDDLIRSIVAAQEAPNEDQDTQDAPSAPPADGETRTSGAPMKLAAVPDGGDELEEPLPYEPEQLHAARDLPGVSKGQQLREQQDRDAEAGDPDGPEDGA